jgi:hypothetical protein
MAKATITLEGRIFRRQYLLYVIELINSGHRYYYIGQTGDRKYITARPPFRRLMGHLEDIGQSTQNQLYRFIAADLLLISDARQKVAFSENIKQQVEDFLVNSMLHMHVYPLETFRPDATHSEHMEVLRKVEELERHVIKRFRDRGLRLANINISAPKNTSLPYADIFGEIERDFGLSVV